MLLGNSNLNSGLYLQINSSGQVILKIGQEAFVSTDEIIFENTWHHLIVNTDCYYYNRLWVDGVEYDIEDRNMDLSSPGRNLYLGFSNGLDNGQEYNGLMDELSIFHSLITQDDFDSYDFSIPEYIPDLMGYWNFNEGVGDNLTDLSGGYITPNGISYDGNNDGTIYGATWSGDVYVPPVYGCMDTYAENYDSDATADDGSCSGYPDNENNSLFFDNDNVSIGEIGDYSSKVTVMAWLKTTTDDGSYHAIVSGSCGNIMLTMHDNRLLFGSQCSEPIQHDTYGTTELNNGEWHHVAATYDENGGENNLKVYVNGVVGSIPPMTYLFAFDLIFEVGFARKIKLYNIHKDLKCIFSNYLVSLNLLSFSISQIIWGPLSTRYGRKVILCYAYLLAIIGTLSAMMSGLRVGGAGLLVIITAYLGYYLGLRSLGGHMDSIDSWVVLFYLLLGTWATSAAAAASPSSPPGAVGVLHVKGPWPDRALRPRKGAECPGIEQRRHRLSKVSDRYSLDWHLSEPRRTQSCGVRAPEVRSDFEQKERRCCER